MDHRLHTFTAGQRLLFDFLRLQRRKALLIFILDIISSTAVIAFSLVLAQTIALLMGFRSLRGELLGMHTLTATGGLWGLLGIINLKLCTDLLRSRQSGRLTEDFAFHLRNIVFTSHTRTNPLGDTGSKLLRLSGDLGSAQRLLAHGVLRNAADWTLLLTGLVFICLINVPLAFLVALLLLAALLTVGRVHRCLRAVEKKRRDKKAALLSFAQAALSEISGIQAMNRATRTEQQFRYRADKVRMLGYMYHFWASLSGTMAGFFTHFVLLFTLAAGFWQGIAAHHLFAVAMILMAWRSAVSRLMRAGVIWKKGLLSLDKIGLADEFEMPEKLGKKNTCVLEVKDLALVLGGRVIFQHLQFTLTPGELVCMALPGGGGKTVLTKLLAGLYRPDSGRIELDGISADDMGLHELRRQITFVSDAFPLSGTTLLDALANSSRRAGMHRATQAFDTFQQQFPVLSGLDLQVRMSKLKPVLSSTQHRLLLVLRAWLADKPFLVLDDPGAGLDDATAKELLDWVRLHFAAKGILLLTTRGQPVQQHFFVQSGNNETTTRYTDTN